LPESHEPYLELSGVSKAFPGVVANDAIDLSVRRGEIHGLLGENGAGKSTLMKILYGLYDADAGTIRLDGEPFDPDSPADAIDRGIGMVHQHFMLIPRLSVAENVVLGDRDLAAARGGPLARLAALPGVGRLVDALTLDLGRPTARIRDLAEEYGLAVDPTDTVADLEVGQRQRVEILKALYRDVDLLVLDEPTAVLAPDEAGRLFDTLRRLAAGGMAIIFITHKLGEVTRLTDRVTVLRDGRRVDTVDTAAVTEDDLAELMVGRDVLFDVDRPPAAVGDPVLEADGLETVDDRGVAGLSGVDLTVREGEVVGVAGVGGNGQADLAEVLVGLERPTAGRIAVDGADLTGRDPRAFLDAGVSYVPADRLGEGVAPELSVMHNLMLKEYRSGGRGRLDYDAAAARARELVEAFDIRGVRDVRETPAGDLSGGNLQKLVLARELSRDPALLVANQPTRGVDVGAVEFLREAILDRRADGTGVVLISEDLDEVFALSDRILVLSEGRIVAETAPGETDRETVGLWMGGERPDDPAYAHEPAAADAAARADGGRDGRGSAALGSGSGGRRDRPGGDG
jgi:simple sugar transport system ATP-binding protein